MKCSEIQSNLSRFHDHELSKEERSEIQKHLMSCAECQSHYREIIEVDNFLRNYKEEDVPEELNQRILAKIRTTHKRSHFISWFERSAVAASIIFALYFGFTSAGNAYDTSNTDIAYPGESSLYSYFEGV